MISQDEGIRRGSTVEKLGALKPAFKPEDGVITAGNSSQISDGSAALLMMTGGEGAELGLTPIARVHTARARRRRPGDHADRADPGHRRRR